MRLRRTVNGLPSNLEWGSLSNRAHRLSRTLQKAESQPNDSQFYITQKKKEHCMIRKMYHCPTIRFLGIRNRGVHIAPTTCDPLGQNCGRASVDALLPARASWIPVFAPLCGCEKSTSRLRARSMSSSPSTGLRPQVRYGPRDDHCRVHDTPRGARSKPYQSLCRISGKSFRNEVPTPM
jgi:hypothetical protein